MIPICKNGKVKTKVYRQLKVQKSGQMLWKTYGETY